MTDKAPTPRILCMFSGGLDSTGVLLRLLSEEKYAGHEIHVHHLVLRNLENRHKAEHRAVHRILGWLRDNGYRSFVYTESEHDYTFLKRYFIFDSYWYGFMAASIVTADPRIRKVAIGRTRSDYDAEDKTWLVVANRGRDIYQATLPLELRHERPYIYPVLELTKKDIWATLPPALRDYAWSCRTPRWVDDEPRACGECPSCRAVQDIHR